MTPPKDRHAERREQSIEKLERAAMELLATHSYADIRIEDITGAAGMAKGSLYMYFKGKDELYLKVFNRLFEAVFKEGFSEAGEQEDPRQALRSLIALTVEQPSPSEEMMFLYRAVLDPALLNLVRVDIDRFLERYLGIFRNLLKRLGREDSEQLGYLLAVLLDGIWFYRVMGMEPADLAGDARKRQALSATITEIFGL